MMSRASHAALGADAMDDKPEASPTSSAKADLAAAVRRAREENAERADAIASLREIEAGRLALLESALKSVVREAPPDVDMFDLTLTQGDKPRLFLDMVAFIEMGRDRRTYRFFQDTLHGRVLIAETDQMGRVVSAATNYVARRLVERERALAAGRNESEPAPLPTAREDIEARSPAAWPIRPTPREALGDAPPPARLTPPKVEPPPRTRRSWLGATLNFLVTTLGSITLVLLLALGAYLAWTLRLRDVWVQLLHRPPPF
jgi:hypothetical protein